MNRDDLESLREAVVAHHLKRLAHDGPPAWFEERAAALVEALLSQPVSHVAKLDSLRLAFTDARSEARVREVAVPAVRFALAEALPRVAAQTASPADVMGAAALEALDTLLAHPDVVDETLLREVAREKALEQVMQDVLFDALTEFSERTNPFIAEWGLPSLLDQVPVFGKGALRKAFGTMRAEFDKRLEPEMRKFLSTFAQKSVERAVDLAVRRRGEPAHVAMRQAVTRRVLERPLADLAWPADDARAVAFGDVVERALVAAAAHELGAALLDDALGDLWTRWSPKTVREVLDEIGVAVPDPAPYAQAAWPLVRAALSSEPVVEELRVMLDEAHASWLADR